MHIATEASRPVQAQTKTVYPVLFAISFVHLLNDSMQSVIPAIYPILQDSLNLTYFQIGLIGFAINMTGSVMQPVVGLYTDKRPMPNVLPIGMLFSLLGMLGLAFANHYALVLLSVVMVGLGSAVFHPEGSRVVYLAAGERRGLAQSIFQVGGNSGQSLAPLMTVLIFVPLGQRGALWFTVIAALACIVLIVLSRWAVERAHTLSQAKKKQRVNEGPALSAKTIRYAMLLLLFFIFARSWYHAGISSYYPFYLIHEYGLTIAEAQYFIFTFLVAGAAGTFFGGPLADRFGKKRIMLLSILIPAPLALLLPFVSLGWVYVLLALIGFVMLSSFSVTVVYAQELVPGKLGTVTGLTIGLAFGMGAIGSVALGGLVDLFGLRTVMIGVAVLPLLGLVAGLLPSDRQFTSAAKG